MGTPDATMPCSPPKPSPNLSERGVASDLTRIGTTYSVLSTLPLYLIVYSVETPSRPQYPLPQTILHRKYPPPETFVLPLSGCGLSYGYDPAGSGDPLLRQSYLMTQPTYIVAWVCMYVVVGVSQYPSMIGTLYLQVSWIPSLALTGRIIVLLGTPHCNG